MQAQLPTKLTFLGCSGSSLYLRSLARYHRVRLECLFLHQTLSMMYKPDRFVT